MESKPASVSGESSSVRPSQGFLTRMAGLFKGTCSLISYVVLRPDVRRCPEKLSLVVSRKCEPPESVFNGGRDEATARHAIQTMIEVQTGSYSFTVSEGPHQGKQVNVTIWSPTSWAEAQRHLGYKEEPLLEGSSATGVMEFVEEHDNALSVSIRTDDASAERLLALIVNERCSFELRLELSRTIRPYDLAPYKVLSWETRLTAPAQNISEDKLN